jgi:TRAP-type C4-dicarboxylate transport system substrate-binding protein
VVKTVVDDVSHGVFPAVVMMGVNTNKWESLSQGRKEILAKEIPHAIMKVVEGYYVDEVKGTELALANGAKFISLGDGFAQAWADFQAAERTEVIAAAEARGAMGAAAAVDANIALLAEWEAIVADVGKDPAALADRLYERVFAKIVN